MTIVDRYLFFLFLKTFLVCFLSFSGLYVVIHLFSNLDEIVAIADSDGWVTVFYEFYVPRIAQLFDKTAAILTLAAAIFSVSLLQRRREMTAIEAAGITKARILRSIFVTAILIIGLTIANREYFIPQVKDRLVRMPRTWSNQGQVDLTVQEDLVSGVVVRGDQLFLGERRISEANIQLPTSLSQDINSLYANWAILEPANEDHPAGLWLHQVTKPVDLERFKSIKSTDGKTAVYFSGDHPWLSPTQCFVACDFEMEQMAYGARMLDFQSTQEMIAELRKPQKWFGHGQQIGIHSRLVRPLLDFTLLMLGLPMVIGGIERNVFVSAGICFWIVAAVQLTTIACHTLGTASLIRPAALAAWIPIAVFFPVSILALRKLKS